MYGLISPSALSLLGVNLGVVYFAVKDEWQLATILASYLLQSIIIGLFQALKMWELKAFSTDGLKINDHPVEPTPATQRTVVLFFLLHYGIFHTAYAAFILSNGKPDWLAVLSSGLAFFANHLFSYFTNRDRPRQKIPNIGSMMFFPYIRILPMHAFIMFGAFTAGSNSGLVFFLILKTLADETMHLIEHRSETL
jgi:FtsH-binding integral membrane protein